MEVKTRYLDGVGFEMETRGHKVISDQPADNGGRDRGMTPPELLLASLGSCAGFYAAQYLKTRNLSTDGLEVVVRAEKATQPARLGSFVIEVTAPPLDEKGQAGLLRAVELCLVHNTLTHTPTVRTVLKGQA